jgi:hypothetical protein
MGTMAQEPAEVSREVASEARIAAGGVLIGALEVAPHAETVEAPMAASPNRRHTGRQDRGHVRACRESPAHRLELTAGIATLTLPSSRRSPSSRPSGEYRAAAEEST